MGPLLYAITNTDWPNKNIFMLEQLRYISVKLAFNKPRSCKRLKCDQFSKQNYDNTSQKWYWLKWIWIKIHLSKSLKLKLEVKKHLMYICCFFYLHVYQKYYKIQASNIKPIPINMPDITENHSSSGGMHWNVSL